MEVCQENLQKNHKKVIFANKIPRQKKERRGYDGGIIQDKKIICPESPVL
jgi:hypothetical protein